MLNNNKKKKITGIHVFVICQAPCARLPTSNSYSTSVAKCTAFSKILAASQLYLSIYTPCEVLHLILLTLPYYYNVVTMAEWVLRGRVCTLCE